MVARDLMTPEPVFVQADDTIGDAAAMMASYDVGAVPVLDDRNGGRLIGMITDRDLAIRCTARHHDPMKCSVEDHMTTSDLATVRPDAPLFEIIEKMERSQVRRLAVVDGDLRLIGIVGQADLARFVGPHDPALVEQMLVRVSAPTPASGY